MAPGKTMVTFGDLGDVMGRGGTMDQDRSFDSSLGNKGA